MSPDIQDYVHIMLKILMLVFQFLIVDGVKREELVFLEASMVHSIADYVQKIIIIFMKLQLL